MIDATGSSSHASPSHIHASSYAILRSAGLKSSTLMIFEKWTVAASCLRVADRIKVRIEGNVVGERRAVSRGDTANVSARVRFIGFVEVRGERHRSVGAGNRHIYDREHERFGHE
jgi:hypothetical protein